MNTQDDIAYWQLTPAQAARHHARLATHHARRARHHADKAKAGVRTLIRIAWLQAAVFALAVINLIASEITQ